LYVGCLGRYEPLVGDHDLRGGTVAVAVDVDMDGLFVVVVVEGLRAKVVGADGSAGGSGGAGVVDAVIWTVVVVVVVIVVVWVVVDGRSVVDTVPGMTFGIRGLYSSS
jgi:uncharacterized membrane protein